MILAFLFSPDTWGTVSDWFMVSVTVITAYYLYKTLQSQKEVQKTQNELFRIESIRFRESIKPVLKYAATTKLFIPGEDGKRILTLEVSNETEAQALEISKILKGGEQFNQIFIPLGFDDRRNHLVKGDKPILFHFMIENEPNLNFLNFAVSYKDVAGTKYEQGVFCICDGLGIEIN